MIRIFFLPRRARHAAVGLVVATLLSLTAVAQLGGSSGVVLPYSGYLELDGAPVNSLSPVNLRFTLWSAASGGSACATQYTESSVVSAGRFSVEIGPVAEDCVMGREVHLEVEVEGADGFVALAGRQRVYPALGALTSGTGDLYVAGDVDVVGDAYGSRLRLSATDDLSLGSTANGLIIGPTSGANLALDNNEIMARSNGAAQALYLNNDGGNVQLGNSSSNVFMPGTAYATTVNATTMNATTLGATGSVSAGALTVSGNATGFVRGGGTRTRTSTSATLLACTSWGTGHCTQTSGSCATGPSCEKGTLTWVSGLTQCYWNDQWNAGCLSWVCVE